MITIHRELLDTGKIITIKVDVDTDRGTRIGVPNLQRLFAELNIPATFLFSLGPDNTGRAIKRIFRPGFLQKVGRSGVVSMYGLRTLLNGTLLPGPHIAKRNKTLLQSVYQSGHEVGIHCYDHIRWQDGLAKMTQAQVFVEFAKARQEFLEVFQFPAKTAGAAGWQANAFSLAAYDDAQLLYGSDARGSYPFLPRIADTTFKTLQIPTTLPTLDELLGRPEYPFAQLQTFYLQLLQENTLHVLTIHAEIEGMKYFDWFKMLLREIQAQGGQFMKLEDVAEQYLRDPAQIPVCELLPGHVDGRSGTLAVQKLAVTTNTSPLPRAGEG